MNPEFKAWFFRLDTEAVPLNQSNQDTPLTSKSGTDNKGNIINLTFKNGGYPNQTIWTKLFNSILFKLESNDRAKDSTQNKSPKGQIYGGHVTLATNTQAKNRENGDIQLESRVPRVSHLPSVESSVTPTVDMTDPFVTITAHPIDNILVEKSGTTKDEYKVSLNNTIFSWIKTTLISFRTSILNDVNTLITTSNGVSVSQKIIVPSIGSPTTYTQLHTVNSKDVEVIVYRPNNINDNLERVYIPYIIVNTQRIDLSGIQSGDIIYIKRLL